MPRAAVLIALLFVTACKKQPPAGDLPPAHDPQAAKPAAPTPPPPPNPHGDSAGGSPHGGTSDQPRAEPTEPRALDKLPDGRLALGPFSVATPADWTIKPITSTMRVAHFVLPGKPGAEAELIVYYFGEGGAGGVEDNLNRWIGQFRQPDGKNSRDVAKIEKATYGGQDATFVSVSGRYVADAMPGATAAVDKPDQALLGAIVASPSGPYYFKLVGPKSTVDASAAAFRAMLGSLKLR